MNEFKAIFDERFYRWSLDQWDRELQSDFRSLRAMHHDAIARHAVGVLESYDLDLLRKIANALAKRVVSEDILVRCSETPSSLEESKLIECFVHHLQEEAWREASRIQTRSLEDEKDNEIFNKKLFRKTVISELTLIFGSKYDNLGGGEIAFNVPIGTWELVTQLDFGGRVDNLSYSHYIMDNNGNMFAERISLLQWLGISGETNWQDLDNSDIEEASSTCAGICAHFANEVPELLNGLGI